MNMNAWMEGFIRRMRETFGERLLFVGLQGSRGRGEAAADSDIDVVVLLDRLGPDDLDAYREAAASLPEREKLCGFVSGREELAAWDRADLFQFYRDTVPCQGSLDFLRPLIREADIRRSVHLGACNLYHACCHNYLHERAPELLRSCRKSAFFILQAKRFLETGEYVSRKTELLALLTGADREVLAPLLEDEEDFETGSKTLLAWASALIRQYAEE